MKSMQDVVYIVTASTPRGEAIRQAIDLRGFDEIICVPYPKATEQFKKHPPALTIIDMEGDVPKTIELVTQLPTATKSIVLVEAFSEELFLACHDHGVRDFLQKPVPDSCLVAHVLRCLQEHRQAQLVAQKDRILVEMGVLSEKTGVFTTSYLLKMLQKDTEALTPKQAESLSLLIVQLEGYQSPLPKALQEKLYADVARIIKDCARDLDLVGECFLDKFAVILPRTGNRGARALAKRLLVRLNGYELSDPSHPVSLQVRIGIAEYGGCRHYEDLLNHALEDLKSPHAHVSGNLPMI